MKSPYKMALKIPLLFVGDCFVKKETVNGIIGNTQGVSKASNPPIKPKKKIFIKLLPEFELVFSVLFKSAVFFKSSCKAAFSFLLFSSKTMATFFIFSPFKEKEKSSSICMQASLQTCANKFNFTLVISLFVSSIRCVIVAFSLKNISSFFQTSV